MSSVSTLSEMTAVGLGLSPTYFSDAGRYGYVLNQTSTRKKKRRRRKKK